MQSFWDGFEKWAGVKDSVKRLFSKAEKKAPKSLWSKFKDSPTAMSVGGGALLGLGTGGLHHGLRVIGTKGREGVRLDRQVQEGDLARSLAMGALTGGVLGAVSSARYHAARR